MNLTICHYIEQQPAWPQSGRHIMAQFDEESIIVYQAYRPAIAHYAVANQRFGGEFSYARMSWIKPNFLWMMYRAGWATKEGQEHILAVRLKRPFFEELLENAVASSFGASGFDSHEAWSHAVAHSDVRLQWDPDHHPNGNKLERRAIQLGLRGEMLNRYGSQEVLSIEDITPFVIQQRQYLPGNFEELQMPSEQVFHPFSPKAAETVGCMPCQ